MVSRGGGGGIFGIVLLYTIIITYSFNEVTSLIENA